MRVSIESVDRFSFDSCLDALASILHACVHDGASVGFILPFPLEDARAYWLGQVRPAVVAGDVVLMVARGPEGIVGTVQLQWAAMPNQAHRADVCKLLVHPDARRRGIARALMAELERRAVEGRRSLLTLDTRTGDTAEPLYRTLGFQTVGVIPDFCRDTASDRLDGTTLMYKKLALAPRDPETAVSPAAG